MSEQVNGQLTLYPVDSPANPFPWLESKKGKTTTVTSGLRCSGLSESCARIASSVRMCLESSRLPPGKWSRIWNAQAITSSCSILKLRLSEPGTGDRGCSSSASQMWPTPTRMDYAKELMRSTQQKAGSRRSLDLPSAVRPMADAACERIQRHAAICAAKPAERSGQMQSDAGNSDGSDACNTVRAGLSDGAEEAVRQSRPRKQPQRSNWWAAEPDVGRVAHGIPARVDRLKCLGNAVVPQQAYPIFKALAEELGGSNGPGTECV